MNAPDGTFERARKYLAKVPPSISGSGGHSQAFYAACRIARGFCLGREDTLALLREWNAGCQPPWKERELVHKVEDALKAKGDTGFLLKENERPKTNGKVVSRPLVAVDPPSDKLRDLLGDAMAGRRYAVPWPWPVLTQLSNALLPGTITVLCASYGSAKSFFIIESALFWMQQKITFKLLELEDEREFHTRRALAQLADNAQITDDGWVKANKEATKTAWETHRETTEELGRNIHESPETISIDDLLGWVQEYSRTNRVLVIDPITAKDPSLTPWLDDQRFVRAANNIIRDSGCSLVLVTHPPKGVGYEKNKGLDDVAGGAAFLRFTHTILSIYGMKCIERRTVSKNGRHEEAEINRVVVLKKTRNGRGQGTSLCFLFNSKNLKHYEMGIEVT